MEVFKRIHEQKVFQVYNVSHVIISFLCRTSTVYVFIRIVMFINYEFVYRNSYFKVNSHCRLSYTCTHVRINHDLKIADVNKTFADDDDEIIRFLY